ncbi:MAG: response regulator [Deltaproteobacteria bacterium]|nr:MAG: response regulator [Deltaproteobacteria bacterium]
MKKKILVVDDSIAVARQLGKVIEEFDDYEVIGHARDGAEAIKLYKTLNPDVVLMDIVMPMMDGIQSLRTLMRVDPQARVVMVSSVGGVGQKVEDALRLGARNVVSKPFEPEKIKSVLDKVFVEG